jgi:hypothetical protein
MLFASQGEYFRLHLFDESAQSPIRSTFSGQLRKRGDV